jgi:phage tail-like protein
MNSSSQDSFLYINRENRWKDFHRQRLEISKDGTLKLSSLPLLDGELPAEVAGLLPPTGPAGIAIGREGTIYFSDPAGNRLLKIDGCDRREAPVPCMGGEGEQPTQFREPRGLLHHSTRRALFVADSGNHRIQIFDLKSFQLLDIWGQKGAGPGCFDTPWTLASDIDGNVYVVDYGNKRVQKFDPQGTVISGFWDAVQKSVQEHNLELNRPSDVAVETTAEKTIRIYILDSSARGVFVFTEDGVFERFFGQEILQNPMGLAVGQVAIYVGDNPNNGRGHVFQFSNNGTVVGAAVGYEGPVAALALDTANGLWVHAGVGPAPIRLAVRNGYARNGFMWGGPFRNPSVHPQEWHRLVCTVAPLKKDAHLQLFVLASAEDIALPKDNDVPPWKDSSVEFAKYLLSGQYDGVWTALPLDVPGGVIPAVQLKPNNPSQSKHLNYLWVGVELSSEGLSSPELSQMRIDFDHETYLQYLPPIFSENSRSRLFLARFLSLFESLFSEVEGSISNLATLFDSTAVPAEWLPWFAGWLAVDLKEDWDDAQKRQTIREAFQTYAWRGTAVGLRQALWRFAGVEARIEEPILNAAWWSLPPDETAPPLQTGNSILGFTTMLAPAEAQGAVLGTTAILDQSRLITDEEFGAPLFEDVAHQFSVLVYRGQVNTDQQLNELCALIDREKPAHTAYHLCIVEPRMRIGFQARVGIDTVVAGPPPSTRLGELTAFGSQMVLGGAPLGRIGEQSRLGQTMRLSDAAVEGPTLSP